MQYQHYIDGLRRAEGTPSGLIARHNRQLSLRRRSFRPIEPGRRRIPSQPAEHAERRQPFRAGGRVPSEHHAHGRLYSEQAAHRLLDGPCPRRVELPPRPDESHRVKQPAHGHSDAAGSDGIQLPPRPDESHRVEQPAHGHADAAGSDGIQLSSRPDQFGFAGQHCAPVQFDGRPESLHLLADLSDQLDQPFGLDESRQLDTVRKGSAARFARIELPSRHHRQP